MRLLGRRRGANGASARGSTRLPQRGSAGDALAMRDTLAAMHAEAREAAGGGNDLNLRALVRDLLDGEVLAPTADVAALVGRRTDADDFYEREIAPNWEGLGEAQRAQRLESFLELAATLEAAGDAAGLPPEMAATMRTKTLVLAWAFDETYGYVARIARGETGGGD